MNRYLRFKRSQIQLRDYILSKINEFLAGLDRHKLPRISLSLAGLPTIPDTDKLMKDLVAGKVGFKEIIERVKP